MCSRKKHQELWWNLFSCAPPQERKTQSYLCCRGGYSLELPASEIAAQINASQSSSNRHISTSTVQRRLCESGLRGWIAAKKPLLKDTNKEKRLAWAKKHEQWTLDRCKFVLWSGVQIVDFWFQLPCLCETRCGWTDYHCMCISHRKAWRRWWYGALLVTLSVNYLEFKAHLTSMATTVFCSVMPSHLVWA